MRKLLILLLGAILLGILSYFCFLNKADGIRDDLVSKAQSAYTSQEMDWVNTSVKGSDLAMTRTLILEGTAPTEALKSQASQIALAQIGVEGVDNHLSIAKQKTQAIKEVPAPVEVVKEPVIVAVAEPVQVTPIPSPYVFSAQKDESAKVTLQGYVPDSKVHSDLVAQANRLFGNANVVDALKESIGAPIAWAKSAKLGLTQLAVVDQGALEMSNQDFHFKGSVDDAHKKAFLLQEFEDGLYGGSLGNYEIDSPAPVPSPYVIHAKKESDNRVILSGYVPDAKAHKNLLAQAKKLFGKNITDQLKENHGAPNEWMQSAQLGLAKLASVDYGQFKISNQDFHFKGHVNNIYEKELLIQEFDNSLYGGYLGDYDIDTPTIKPVEAIAAVYSCQGEFSKILQSKKIHFEYNKADIKKASYTLLNTLADVAKKCPKELISIGGHTDSTGSANYNLKLSSNRAKAVKNYLVKRGLSPKRVKATGHGEATPLASNSTKQGRAKNRRIEFTIKGMK